MLPFRHNVFIRLILGKKSDFLVHGKPSRVCPPRKKCLSGKWNLRCVVFLRAHKRGRKNGCNSEIVGNRGLAMAIMEKDPPNMFLSGRFHGCLADNGSGWIFDWSNTVWLLD